MIPLNSIYCVKSMRINLRIPQDVVVGGVKGIPLFLNLANYKTHPRQTITKWHPMVPGTVLFGRSKNYEFYSTKKHYNNISPMYFICNEAEIKGAVPKR